MNVISIENLLKKILNYSKGKKRFIIAIAGPPGSGKSTISNKISFYLGKKIKILPMDGFHLENQQLITLKLLDRKGAPETFDTKKFVNTVKKLKKSETIFYPTFDRSLDKTIPNSEVITKCNKIILVEGNYLLLNYKPWSNLRNLFDLTIFLDVKKKELISRLIRRWIDHGLTEMQAKKRAIGNDMVNVEVVLKKSFRADYKLF